MEFIPAKRIISGYAKDNAWFGNNYNMNIYKGCCHGCIYCDSRSECYGVYNFDEVKAKEADLEKNVKMLLKGDCLIPTIAIVDPDFSMDMPKSVTAATGLDALTHAVEAYTSKLANPLTDCLAISAIKRIMEYLPLAYQNGFHAKAREEMSQSGR